MAAITKRQYIEPTETRTEGPIPRQQGENAGKYVLAPLVGEALGQSGSDSCPAAALAVRQFALDALSLANKLSSYKSDWDGFGSDAPQRASVLRMLELYYAMLLRASQGHHVFPLPHFSANECGEAFMEWWHDDRKLTMFWNGEHFEFMKAAGDPIGEPEERQFHVNDTTRLLAWLMG